MKPNMHGNLFSQFTSHLLKIKTRNTLRCNNFTVQPYLTKAFLDLDVKELHVKIREEVWDGHVSHIRPMQGIQNVWELPEETVSQTSSKQIGKFPHAPYTNR